MEELKERLQCHWLQALQAEGDLSGLIGKLVARLRSDQLSDRRKQLELDLEDATASLEKARLHLMKLREHYFDGRIDDKTFDFERRQLEADIQKREHQAFCIEKEWLDTRAMASTEEREKKRPSVQAFLALLHRPCPTV